MATKLTPVAPRHRCPITGVPLPKMGWTMPAAWAIWLGPYLVMAFLMPFLPWWLWALKVVSYGVLLLGTTLALRKLAWWRWHRHFTPEVIHAHFERTMQARYENAWLN